MKNLLVFLTLTFSTVFASLSHAVGLPDFTELVEKQGATVVNISTTQVIKGRRGAQPFQFDGDEATQEFLSLIHISEPTRPD